MRGDAGRYECDYGINDHPEKRKREELSFINMTYIVKLLKATE